MRFQFETNGLRLIGSTGGGLVLEMGDARQQISAADAEALAEAFAMAARLTERAVSAPKAPGVPAAAPAVVVVPATSDATGTAAFGTTHRDSGLLLLDGEPVKRGPRAAQERAGPRKGKRRGRPPGSAKARAARVNAGAAAAAKTSDVTSKASPQARAAVPAANRRGRGRPPGGRSGRNRKPIVDSMAAWMRANSGAQSVDALVTAAVSGRWTAAKEVAPAIRAALSRNAEVFARQADGTFILRASLPPGKVVRRRRRDRSE